ncbi:hypothetical protein [Brasilonema sp. UFV-L1]|uniref:hypothetical protein n=1 Tax=Brasilonema sp. UFV-L1 TaxID=2234130 RepID=UPI00145EA824|nr:hypothetical protein [Brasilonema sp. UFV-L1]NMG08257.1 hypothetical protein [Brasilonema sp. UFV-L1]
MYKSKITYFLFALTLILVLSWTTISKLPNALTCQQSNVVQATGSERHYTHPDKVIVEPWRGEHHVYAIFMIPGGYLNDKFFTVTIKGAGTFCGVFNFAGTTVADGVYAKPGHYLMKALFKTRIAVGLIAQGKKDELKDPRNWRVGYTKIEEKR